MGSGNQRQVSTTRYQIPGIHNNSTSTAERGISPTLTLYQPNPSFPSPHLVVSATGIFYILSLIVQFSIPRSLPAVLRLARSPPASSSIAVPAFVLDFFRFFLHLKSQRGHCSRVLLPLQQCRYTGTIAATSTTTGVVLIGAKRYQRHDGGQPALQRTTTTVYDVPAKNAGTIAVTRTTLRVPLLLVVPTCAKRFHRQYSGQRALLNRHYRGTLMRVAHRPLRSLHRRCSGCCTRRTGAGSRMSSQCRGC